MEGYTRSQTDKDQPFLLSPKRQLLAHTVNKKRVLYGGFALLILSGIYLGFMSLHVSAGHKLWSFQMGSYFTGISPATSAGVVYMGARDGKVSALDAASGRVRWSVQTKGDSVASSLVAANDLVYLINAGTLYALSARSGQVQWSFRTSTSDGVSPALMSHTLYVSVYVSSLNADANKLEALDARTGQEKWSFQLDDMASTPTVADGLVYVNVGGDSLSAVDAASGKLRWTAFGDYAPSSSPIVVNGLVYMISTDGKVSVYNAQSGAKQWSIQVAVRKIFVNSSPAVGYGLIYFYANKTLYVCDVRTGQEKWSYQPGGYIYASPAVVNGVVYVGSQDHSLYALDGLTGEKKWSYQTGGAIASTPIVVNNIIYVGSGDGNVYALQAP